MTQEEKQLLLKDLSARLPYGVRVAYPIWEGCDLNEIVDRRCNPPLRVKDVIDLTYIFRSDGILHLPYLRPMSSMTEEEEKEYTNIDNRSYSCPKDYAHIPAQNRIDWLNAHHFDYRGLIDKGLALEAPEGMYNCK